jgi:hypothetical protein
MKKRKEEREKKNTVVRVSFQLQLRLQLYSYNNQTDKPINNTKKNKLSYMKRKKEREG